MHFEKSPCSLIYIRWTHSAITKLPFNKSKDILSSHPQIPIPLISSLCYALCPEAHSHSIIFFFFLCLLQHAFFYIYIFLILFKSNMIWEIHFEGRVLINKTLSNTDLLPKTTRYQHWSGIFFYLSKKKFQILHALFLLMIYLFSCRVLKKFVGTCFVIFFLLWMLCLSKLCDI